MPKDLDVNIAVVLPADNRYGGKWNLNIGECTGRDDLDVRQKTGYSLVGLVQEVDKDQGLALVLIGCVVWLARRKQFPMTDFDEVLTAIPWSTDFELETDAEVDDEGKLQGSGNVSSVPELSPPSPTISD